MVITFLPGFPRLGPLGGLAAGALPAALLFAPRRNRGLQISALAGLAVVLLVLALTMSTLGVVRF